MGTILKLGYRVWFAFEAANEYRPVQESRYNCSYKLLALNETRLTVFEPGLDSATLSRFLFECCT